MSTWISKRIDLDPRRNVYQGRPKGESMIDPDFEELVLEQKKARKTTISKYIRILEDSIQQINRVRDPGFAADSSKSMIKIRLQKLLKELNE